MGCFLVVTKEDYDQIERMSIVSKHAYPFELVSRIHNPITQKTEVLIETEREFANFVRKMFPDTRKSQQQDSHHVFPKAHKTFFENRAGIDVDQFAVLADQKSHLQMHNAREGYNRAWKAFVEECNKDPNLTKDQVKQSAIYAAGDLITKFGFGDNRDISRYRKHPK